MGRKAGPRGKTEQITVSVPAEVLERLEAEARMRGMSRSSMAVLMFDLYFRDRTAEAAPAPERGETGGLTGDELEALRSIPDRLEAIERKTDRSIEVSLSAREAVRAAPDLIREDLARHTENLRAWAQGVMSIGSGTVTLVGEQLEEVLGKLGIVAENLARMREKLGIQTLRDEGN